MIYNSLRAVSVSVLTVFCTVFCLGAIVAAAFLLPGCVTGKDGTRDLDPALVEDLAPTIDLAVSAALVASYSADKKALGYWEGAAGVINTFILQEDLTGAALSTALKDSGQFNSPTGLLVVKGIIGAYTPLAKRYLVKKPGGNVIQNRAGLTKLLHEITGSINSTAQSIAQAAAGEDVG